MATSGSINYSTSTQEIITEALELLGILGEGESYNTNQYTSALRTLNSMIKMWQADGLNLFAVQKLYLFPNLGQPYYDLSSTSEDLMTSNFGLRFVDGDFVENDTVITVDDASDMSAGFYIGIQTSGTRIFWATIVSIAGEDVTLSDGIDADVSDGAKVYYFQTIAHRPMRILEGYIHKNDGAEIPIEQLSRVDYYSLSNKSTSGQITQFYYDPQVGTGKLYVWPTGSSELDYLVFLVQRTLEDFDNATDEPDYPQEWYMPLAYNLALVMAPKYGTPAMDYNRIKELASHFYTTAKNWDEEQETSVYLKPNTWKMDSSYKL